MCSILSIITNKVFSPTFESMANKLLSMTEKRGPDESNSIIFDNKIYLGNNRLSIIGKQSNCTMPMKCKDREFWITYNGEIYNYKELKEELVQNGLTFSNDSDTEVILKGYEFWGEKVVSKLNGIFAFVIYDKEKNKIIAARDRFGAKPLFYICKKDLLIFSSDFLVLREVISTNKKPVISQSALTSFLLCRFVPGDKTIFEEINKLKPAEIQVWNLNNLSHRSEIYWQPTFTPRIFSQDEFNEAFSKSVAATSEADEKACVLLSGGLDSSAIVARLHSLGKKNLDTYSCSFDDVKSTLFSKDVLEAKITNDVLDESEFAQEVADQYSTNHHHYSINSDLSIAQFETMQKALGEPVASPNAIGLFLLGEKMKGKTKLALCGTGADELLGGYQKLYVKNIFKKFSTITNSELLNIFSDFDSDTGSEFILNFLSKENVEQTYLENFLESSMVKFDDQQYNNELLNQLLFFELAFGLPGWELDQADRIFMNFSIELRPSFLENDFLNYCLSIYSTDKFNKNPLRVAVENELPKSIVNREKLPSLSTPSTALEQKWFTTIIDDVKTNPHEIWNVEFLSKYLDKPREEMSFDLIYRIVYLQKWLKTYHEKSNYNFELI